MKNRNWMEWLKMAGVRALKTVAQTALGMIGTTVLMQDISLQVVLLASLLAGLTSLLTSLKGLPELHESA